jgi:hypothetical protein
METANESVYLGREDTGAAQILGSPINVWGQVFAQQRQKEKDEASARKQQFELVKWKDKQIKDWEQTKFDKPWQMYAEQIQKDVNDYRQTFRQLQGDGYDVNDAKRMTDQYRSDIDRKIARTLNADAAYKDALTRLKQDKLIDADWTSGYLNDKLVTSNIDEADLDGGNKALSHPRSLNAIAAIDESVVPIKNQLGFSNPNEQELKNSALGQYLVVNEGRARFGYVDESGNTILGVSDDLVDNVFDTEPRLFDRLLWQYVAEKNGLDQRLDADKIDVEFEKIRLNPGNEATIYARKVIKDRLNQLQQINERGKIQRMGQFPSAANTAKTKQRESDIIERDKVLQIQQTPFGMAGELDEPTQESLQLSKQLIGGKFGNMPIEDVEIVKAGKKSSFDNTIKTYDRYLFKVTEGKVSGEANTTTREIDLTKGNYGFWNTLQNTVPGAKKIDIGDLTKQNESQKQKTDTYDDL